MFLKNLLHKHSRVVVDETGNRVTVPATCAEINSLIGSHVMVRSVDDGNGGVRLVREVVSCAQVDEEHRRVCVANEQLATRVEQLTDRVEALTKERDNGVRLMANALQVIFGMGPALKDLLTDDLGDPDLTSDRTAVKLEAVDYSIIINPFGERLIVRAANSGMREESFAICNGELSATSQKLLLAEIICIKAVAAGGENPVRGTINLITVPAGQA